MNADITPNTRKEAPRQEPLRGKDSRRDDVIPLGTDNPEQRGGNPDQGGGEQLAPLFAQDAADDYRARWIVVQQGFVDDPRKAVQQGDELVREVISNLAETFSQEGTALDGEAGDSQDTSTETLRVALRRYRAFFERLLSV
jgi:hypothetical protein